MKRKGIRLFRYAITAGTAAIADIGVFALLHAWGLDLTPAAALSFLMATIVNYILTARCVFHVPIGLVGYWRFLSAASLGFALNIGVTAATASLVAFPPLFAKTTGVAVAFLVNFALNTIFVFRL